MLDSLTARLAMPWQARAHLYVGVDRLRVQVARRGWRVSKKDGDMLAEVAREAQEPLAVALVSLLRDLAPKLGRTQVDVTIDDDLVRLFSVAPPAGARGWGDLRAAAGLRFERLYGEPLEGGWCVEAAWHARRRFMAVAVPRSLQDALVGVQGDLRWPIRSIAPNAVRAWHARRELLRRPGTWLAVRGTTGALTVCARTDDGDQVRQTRAPALDWSEPMALKRWVENEALQLDVDPPRTLVLCSAADDPLGVEPRQIDGLTVIDGISARSAMDVAGASA